ncbi:MAG: Unknown protein [uncultured Aureispira sp.]|uniref:Uncharacterized protein n=1 Tax=uncultured Aureispira sp. TaxID=1331704 RepID=A0A6S6S6P0_9BACT|nr:MAG: Unknown protein [uncultured Aureispira sp.]
MLPNSNEKEWRDLLLNREVPALKSLSLKLKLASLKANIKIEQATVAEAILELHAYCAANQKLYKKDLELIFGNA